MAALAEKVEVIIEEPEEETSAEVDNEAEKAEEVDNEAEEVDNKAELEVPEGGIGNFAMSDEDFATLEAEEAKKEFGEDGLAQFTAVAKKMAGHGRFGDDSVAHIQTGEIVVPLTLIENNPALKEQIFKQLRDSGIEDPEQYVVGSKANRINPETGLMEFGFFSGVWKNVKKVSKKVWKVVRQVLPVVLPIAMSFIPGFGPALGMAVGSGIATLAQGGDFTDALQAGFMSYAAGSMFKGIRGAMANRGAAGLDGAVPDGAVPDGAVPDGAVPDGVGEVFDGVYDPVPSVSDAVFSNTAIDPDVYSDFSARYPGASDSVDSSSWDNWKRPFDDWANRTDMQANPKPAPLNFSETVAFDDWAGRTDMTPEPNFWDRATDVGRKADDWLRRGGQSQEALDERGRQASDKYWETTNPAYRSRAEARRVGLEASTPGMLAKYGPALLAYSALSGAFKSPESEGLPENVLDLNEDGTVVTGEDLLAADPGKYLVHDLGNKRLNPDTGKYEEKDDEEKDGSIADPTVQRTAALSLPFQPVAISQNEYLMSNNPGGPFARQYVQQAAEGGPIYPRRNGGIAPSEGVQGQDSVRAMLMPGEFVMTAEAVRGLGDGNLDNGIQNMYAVMRNLESRGKAA